MANLAYRKQSLANASQKLLTPALGDRFLTEHNQSHDGVVFGARTSETLDGATPQAQSRFQLIGKFKLRGWPYFVIALIFGMLGMLQAQTVDMPFAWQYPTNLVSTNISFRLWTSGDQANWIQFKWLTNFADYASIATNGFFRTNYAVGTNNMPIYFSVTAVTRDSTLTNYADSPFSNVASWAGNPPIHPPNFGRTNSFDANATIPTQLVIGDLAAGAGGGGGGGGFSVLGTPLFTGNLIGATDTTGATGTWGTNIFMPDAETLSFGDGTAAQILITGNLSDNPSFTLQSTTGSASVSAGTSGGNFRAALLFFDDTGDFMTTLDPARLLGQERYIFDSSPAIPLTDGYHTVFRNAQTNIVAVNFDGQISLQGKTNLIGDNGSAVTYNGVPIGGGGGFSVTGTPAFTNNLIGSTDLTGATGQWATNLHVTTDDTLAFGDLAGPASYVRLGGNLTDQPTLQMSVKDAGTLSLYAYKNLATNLISVLLFQDNVTSQHLTLLDPANDWGTDRYMFDTSVIPLTSGIHTSWKNSTTNILTLDYNGGFTAGEFAHLGFDPTDINQPFLSITNAGASFIHVGLNSGGQGIVSGPSVVQFTPTIQLQSNLTPVVDNNSNAGGPSSGTFFADVGAYNYYVNTFLSGTNFNRALIWLADTNSPLAIVTQGAGSGGPGRPVAIQPGGTNVMQFDANVGASTTGVLIYENGSAQRISIGLSNSGGVGFRQLIIPN